MNTHGLIEERNQLRRICDAKDATIRDLNAEVDHLRAKVAELEHDSPAGRWRTVQDHVVEVVRQLRPPADGERHLIVVSGHPCWHRRIAPADKIDAFLDYLDEAQP